MKLAIVLAVLCCIADLTACRSGSERNTSSTTSAPAPTSDAPSMRIWISKTGAVEVDGRQVEMESIGAMLAEHAHRKGEVLYGRDAAEEEPHPNAIRVLQMIMTSRLPIRMSTKRDYSDAIRLDGKLME
jgi:hypothetical protein